MGVERGLNIIALQTIAHGVGVYLKTRTMPFVQDFKGPDEKACRERLAWAAQRSAWCPNVLEISRAVSCNLESQLSSIRSAGADMDNPASNFPWSS